MMIRFLVCILLSFSVRWQFPPRLYPILFEKNTVIVRRPRHKRRNPKCDPAPLLDEKEDTSVTINQVLLKTTLNNVRQRHLTRKKRSANYLRDLDANLNIRQSMRS